jgi:hypothetical protein
MRKPAKMAATFASILATWAVPQALGSVPRQIGQAEPIKPPASSPDEPLIPPCFDVALVASAPRYRWLPVPESDDIIIRAPVRITFDVEEVMAGRVTGPTVTINTGLHTRYNKRVRYFLLYLKADRSGRYRIVAGSFDVLRGRDGGFVIPMTKPFDPPSRTGDLFPPPDYEKLVRPIRYLAADAWWLQVSELETRADGSIASESYPWGVLKKDGIVAPRGLRVDDVVKAAPPRRCTAKAG